MINISDIVDALNHELHHVMRMRSVNGIGLYRESQARAMLRIEAGYDAEIVIAEHERRNGWSYVDDDHRTPRAMTLMGVAVYPVRHRLPEPGWRVINPLKVKD